MEKITVPNDFPVRPLKPGQEAKDKVTCGSCGLSWDDAITTSWTPAPGARCPFEYFHAETDHTHNPGRLVDPEDPSLGGYCVECGEVIP